MIQYSKAEIKLVTMFGHEKLLENDSIMPYTLYGMCATEAFINNMTGPHVDALRRGFQAIRSCSPYRLTPEFEELIQF